MKRRIVGYDQDEAGDWFARLDCAHNQHLRHRPPFINRPWIEQAAGRHAHLGSELDCVRCDRLEWPEGVTAYRRTPTFTEETVPKALRQDHATAAGVWGRIQVLEGTLDYHLQPPADCSLVVTPEASGVVVPQLRHRVAPRGKVKFFVEFYRLPEE